MPWTRTVGTSVLPLDRTPQPNKRRSRCAPIRSWLRGPRGSLLGLHQHRLVVHLEPAASRGPAGHAVLVDLLLRRLHEGDLGALVRVPVDPAHTGGVLDRAGVGAVLVADAGSFGPG